MTGRFAALFCDEKNESARVRKDPRMSDQTLKATRQQSIITLLSKSDWLTTDAWLKSSPSAKRRSAGI